MLITKGEVVLDTNVIASRYIVPQGKPAQILDRWSEGAFDLLLSAPILAEIRRVLRYPRLRKKHNLHDAEIDEIIEGLQELAIIVVSERPIRVVADDPDDDKLLECATAGGAEFLVTGDQHLLTLGSFRGIQILPPAVFLAYLDSQLAKS
jgi:putative PIN family toxin of toxin-antitoxin system